MANIEIDNESVLAWTLENLHALEKLGTDPELAEALRQSISGYKKKAALEVSGEALRAAPLVRPLERLLEEYAGRPDLQQAFPEVQNGNYLRLLEEKDGLGFCSLDRPINAGVLSK